MTAPRKMTHQQFDELMEELRDWGERKMHVSSEQFWELWFEFQESGKPPEPYTEKQLWRLWRKHIQNPQIPPQTRTHELGHILGIPKDQTSPISPLHSRNPETD